jgi:XTP/dITP diphosphohydrolase
MSASLPHLILATRNTHKTAEIRAMVGNKFEVFDATAFPDWPIIEETGDTFLQNATLKAVGISSRIDGWVLADDSGLEVDALGGAPGVISSHYGGIEGDHARNNERLLREMRGSADRRARFRCTMVWAKNGIARAHFSGTVEGRILDEACGTQGFGYDPLFAPEGESKSFAELGDAVKHALSHRSRALAQAVAWLEAQQDRSAAQFD